MECQCDACILIFKTIPRTAIFEIENWTSRTRLTMPQRTCAFASAIIILPLISSISLIQRSPDPGDAVSRGIQLLSRTLNASSLLTSNTSSGALVVPGSHLLKLDPPHCKRALGSMLNFETCIQAYSYMVTHLLALPRDKVTIGPRGDGIWDVGEVMTFLSGEPCHVPRLLLGAVPARDGALAKMHYSSTALGRR